MKSTSKTEPADRTLTAGTCAVCDHTLYHAPGPRLVRARDICPRCRTLEIEHIDVDRERVFCAFCWRSEPLAAAGTRASLVFDRFVERHAGCTRGEPL